jgi:hypothetical protein
VEEVKRFVDSRIWLEEFDCEDEFSLERLRRAQRVLWRLRGVEIRIYGPGNNLEELEARCLREEMKSDSRQRTVVQEEAVEEDAPARRLRGAGLGRRQRWGYRKDVGALSRWAAG